MSTEPPVADSGAVDWVVYRTTIADCGFTPAEFFEFYAPQAAAELVALREAHEESDAELVRRLAHGAAGSSATAGLTSLTDAYRAIEFAPADASQEETSALIAAASVHLDAALDALRRDVGADGSTA